MRNHVWHQALSRIERGLVDLTINWVPRVKSGKLAEILGRILTKLLLAMDHTAQETLEKGRTLARKIGETAFNWGNESASEWCSDLNFQKALGLGVLT